MRTDDPNRGANSPLVIGAIAMVVIALAAIIAAKSNCDPPAPSPSAPQSPLAVRRIEEGYIDVYHDDHRQVTCWSAIHTGLSCLPDSALRSDAGGAPPAP